jgi:hypothetical protein
MARLQSLSSKGHWVALGHEHHIAVFQGVIATLLMPDSQFKSHDWLAWKRALVMVRNDAATSPIFLPPMSEI